MIPNSRSLLIKIHDLLDEKMDPQHAGDVASDYNKICTQIDARIRQFSKLMREGHYYAAIDIAQMEPTLTTQIERIRFPREAEWRNYLAEKGIHCFEGFDDADLKRVKEICADRSHTQPAAYRAFRKAILLKDKPCAIRHLRELHKTFPKDRNAERELARLEKEAFEGIEKELTKLLRLGKEQEAIQKVEQTLEQEWIIPLNSESWNAALKLHEKDQRQKYHESILQTISQAKVIQRVGNWEDAKPLIEKLKAARESSVYPELTAVQQNELNAAISWFRQCELENNEELRNEEAFNSFKKTLQPEQLTQQLSSVRKREIRQFQATLQSQWEHFQALTPKMCQANKAQYAEANRTLDEMLHAKSGTGKKRRWLWTPLLPLFLLITGSLFWINHREAQIAKNVILAYDAQDLKSTRAALRTWDGFTETFSADRNPFRHYRAHRQIGEVRSWLQEIDFRHQKINQLFDRIEDSLAGETDRNELRRIQLNLSIVEDLLDKLPRNDEDSLVQRYQLIEQEVVDLHAAHIQQLREELSGELAQIDRLFAEYFPANKTQFEQVYQEISEIQEAIDRLEGKFRQSFEAEDVSDLKAQLDADEQKLKSFDTAVSNLTQFEDRLRQSIALSEYLEYLEQLSKLPFKQHPLVRQSNELIRRRAEFENLAQQLLLPGNPVAWNQFLAKPDEPLTASGTDPKELKAWKNLAGHSALNDIYRYRVVRYKNGAVVGNYRLVYSHGESKIVSEQSQTSGRRVGTLQEFDERYIGRGLPFTEKIYTCETDASGIPIDGEVLEFDRLTPESGYYRQIHELCSWDEEQNAFKEPLLQVIDTVKKEEFISPIFKAWITQQLFDIMIVRAYDWGLNFCPSAQIEYKKLSVIKGTLFPYDWMRPSTQNRILQPLISYYNSLQPLSYHQQALASRELFHQIARQRVRYGGYANENGLFMLLKGTPENRKLFGLKLDGSIGLIRDPGTDEEPPTNFDAEPFTPIMFFNDPPEIILDRVTRNTGVDVNSEAFRPYLPEIFK